MRLPDFSSLSFVALLVFGVHGVPADAWAQQRPIGIAEGYAIVPDVRSELELALRTPNALIHADYHNIDFRFGPNLRIDAVIVRVGSRAEPIRGLRFQVPDDRRPGNPERSSYVDIGEVDALVASLDQMVHLVRGWTVGDDRKMTMLSFTTMDGMRVEIRESARMQRGFIITGVIDPVITQFDLADLPSLKNAIDQAAESLKRK